MSAIIKETIKNFVCHRAVFDFDIDDHYPELNEFYIPTEPLEIPHPSQDKINLFSDVNNVKVYLRNAFEDYKKEKVHGQG